MTETRRSVEKSDERASGPPPVGRTPPVRAAPRQGPQPRPRQGLSTHPKAPALAETETERKPPLRATASYAARPFPDPRRGLRLPPHGLAPLAPPRPWRSSRRRRPLRSPDPPTRHRPHTARADARRRCRARRTAPGAAREPRGRVGVGAAAGNARPGAGGPGARGAGGRSGRADRLGVVGAAACGARRSLGVLLLPKDESPPPAYLVSLPGNGRRG